MTEMRIATDEHTVRELIEATATLADAVSTRAPSTFIEAALIQAYAAATRAAGLTDANDLPQSAFTWGKTR